MQAGQEARTKKLGNYREKIRTQRQKRKKKIKIQEHTVYSYEGKHNKGQMETETLDTYIQVTREEETGGSSADTNRRGRDNGS